MSRRVRVNAFLAAATVTRSGSHPTSNLLGVDYWHEIPADAEFPRVVGRLDLFTRFYVEQARETEFLVSIRWIDSPTKSGQRAVRFGPFRVPFQRHEVVRDHVFRLVNIRIQGVGRYAIRLIGEVPPKLAGEAIRCLGRNRILCAEVIMRRRNQRWDPPLSGPCPNLGPQMSESVSDDEKAGMALPPLVELRPGGPPLEVSEAGPMFDEPPAPPFDRDAVLAGINVAFTQLGDLELEVARRRMLGVSYSSISEELGLLSAEVERVWKKAREKLGMAMVRGMVATQPTTPGSPPSTGPRKESGDIAPA